MTITDIYFSLLIYHRHNFLTCLAQFQPVENGQPGSRPMLPDVTIYLNDSVCTRMPYSSSRKLWGRAPSLIHGVLRCLYCGSHLRNRINRGTKYTAVFVRSMYESAKSGMNITYFSLNMLTLTVLP